MAFATALRLTYRGNEVLRCPRFSELESERVRKPPSKASATFVPCAASEAPVLWSRRPRGTARTAWSTNIILL